MVQCGLEKTTAASPFVLGADQLEKQAMGLFRLAVVGAVGVALLPSDREHQAQFYQRAATATTWAITFCDRNGETCEQAVGLWGQFKKKAEFGAGLAYDMARGNDTKSGQITTSSLTVSPAALPPAATVRIKNTLTGNDLKPEWRGKAAGRSGR